MDKLVLIDGHSILNRAFYGVPDLTNAEGLHTNAVYGFLNIMLKILEEEKADHLAVAFDLPEPTFRHKMFDAYKGTRKPMPEELREQVPLIKEALAAMEIPILTLAGYEADDILGTVAKQCQENGVDVSIVSGDRDLLQLADSHIKIRIPKTSRGTTEIHDYYPEDVKREYQVSPKEFIDVKALMGDSSDNIPGVPSIGEKTATSLIVSYGSIENAYAHLEEIRPPRAQKALEEHYDLAQMSKELAAICTHCPVEFAYEDTKVENLYTSEAFLFMKRMGFKSILSRFSPEAAQERPLEIREQFQVITGRKEAEAVFKKARNAAVAGMQLIFSSSALPGEEGGEGEEQLSFSFDDAGCLKPDETKEKGEFAASGLGLCLGEKEIYCIRTGKEISGKDLIRQVKELCAGPHPVWVLDLKELNIF